MKQFLAITMIVTLGVGQGSLLAAQTAVAATGVIEGSLSGDSGPIAGALIHIVTSEGQTIHTGITGQAGSFSFSNLRMGRYFVQAVDSRGSVLSTKIATLTAENPTADVKMIALSAAKNGGGAASAAGTGALRLAAISAGVAAAATAASVVAIVGTGNDASPSK